MRRLLSVLLGLSLVLGSFGLAFSAVPADVTDTDYEEAVSVLMTLGIIDGYPDGTFRPDNTITRAELAKLLITALEMDDDAIRLYASGLSDVSTHWAKGYVGYADKLDIVVGYPDKSFRPQNPVSYDEAITMIVRALGYTSEDVGKAWPVNYVEKGTELGILEGISGGSSGATRGDIAIMLHRAMKLAIAGDKGDTMLARLTSEEQTYEKWQIPYGERLINEYGLDGAVTDSTPSIMSSQYWQIPDFYNMTSSDTLTILTNYKTTQQTNGWTCGPASALTVLEWWGARGDLNEMDLVSLRQKDEPGATSLRQMIHIFEGLEKNLGQEWDLYSTFDAKIDWDDGAYPYATYEGERVNLFELVPQILKEGKPIIVGWNDWGGHYQTIIGYDTLGTETTADDVLILADPYDTTDHHQDGYLIQSAERLIWDWSAGWDPDFDYGIFLVATPEGVDGKDIVVGDGIKDDYKNTGRFTDTHMIPYGESLAAAILALDSVEPYATDYPNWFGADGLSGPASADVFRTADYKYSPYYKNVDVYNLKSTPTRTMLQGYKSIQQATEYTCGVTSMLTVLDWFDKRSDMNEMDLANLRNKTDGLPGTTVKEMLAVIDQLPGDWDVKSSYDIVDGDSYFECGIEVDGEYIDLGDMIPYYLEQEIPVMVMWHEWGGHYQTVIGYDNMGTEGTCDDVILLMDPYDTTDHNQNGYVVESFERLIYDWGNSYDADMDWAAFVVMAPVAAQ
ncbi:MAG: S-layer homology domain-containing protein [Anaerovoracaceae bacterium]